jgi:hypothetical protein
LVAEEEEEEEEEEKDNNNKKSILVFAENQPRFLKKPSYSD